MNCQENINLKMSNINTLDRYEIHYFLKNLDYCTVTEETLTYDKQVKFTFWFEGSKTLNIPTISYRSAALLPETITVFREQTLNKLYENLDATILVKFKHQAEKALNEAGFAFNIVDATKILTLLQLTYTLNERQKGSHSTYTEEQLKERIPLVLAKLPLRKKILMSITNNTTMFDAESLQVLPEEWLIKLNS
jgi:predicted RNA binding protein YcfA (HicA-like mRNA interferase family)